MGGQKSNYICFTAFDTLENIKTRLLNHIDYLIIGGQEATKSGKLHYHGLAYSKKQQGWIKLTKTYHLEVEEKFKSHQAWIQYACKVRTKVDPNELVACEIGVKPKTLEPKKTKGLTNQEILETSLQSLIMDNHISILKYDQAKRSIDKFKLDTMKMVDASGPKGIWVYGAPGVGKSFSVRQTFPDLFLKPQNKWWDGYNGQSTVLLDDFDSDCLGHLLKIWADAYGFNGEVKNGTIPLCYDRFIITSNYTIEELFQKVIGLEDPLVAAIKRRFKFVHKTSMDHDISEFLKS